MHILIKTIVGQEINNVYEGFDKDLFLKLKPPGLSMKLLRFDGSEKGDIVQLELNFLLFKQKWTSTITKSEKSDDEIYFVDEAEGKELPFFLKKWKHKHRLIKDGDGTQIIDDIEYKSPFGFNLVLYPLLYLQMAYRKPIYRKTFRKISTNKI